MKQAGSSFQLSRVDEHQVLAVIVVEGNVIKNTMLHVDEAPDQETMLSSTSC